MRTLAALVATTFVALMVASVASAAPTISLVWTGTTGTGVTGSSSIDANVGDVLALDIRINVDNTGLSGAFVTLSHNGAELLALLGYGAGPGGTTTEICPNPPNPAGPESCSVGTPARTYSSITSSYYLTDTYNGLPNHLGQFNAVKVGAPFATNGVMTLGRAIFQVAGGALSTVNVANVLGLDSVNDSAGNVFNPTASATVIIPEPTTAALLGLGVFGLAIAGRRRA
jgi:hypothetical protein